MNNIHPIFSEILRAYEPPSNIVHLPPVAEPISQPISRALGRMAAQLLVKTESEIAQHIDAGERLVGTMEDTLADVDEAKNDEARDRLVRELTVMRTLYASHIREAARLIAEAADLRERAGKAPSVLQDLIAAVTG